LHKFEGRYTQEDVILTDVIFTLFLRIEEAEAKETIVKVARSLKENM